MNEMLKNQHNKIQITFGQSITVLEHRFNNKTLSSDLVDNISQMGMHFIFHEAKRGKKTCSDSSKYGCTLRKTYDLACACIISKKMKLDARYVWMKSTVIGKRLQFDDNCVMKDGKANIIIVIEWEIMQDRTSKADNTMKFHIKDQLKKIAYHKITYLKPPSESVKIKGALKKVKLTQDDN